MKKNPFLLQGWKRVEGPHVTPAWHNPETTDIFYLDYIGMDVITCFKVLAMIVLNKGISPGTELSMVEPQRQRRKYLQAAKFVFIFSLSFCLWSLSLMICIFH